MGKMDAGKQGQTVHRSEVITKKGKRKTDKQTNSQSEKKIKEYILHELLSEEQTGKQTSFAPEKKFLTKPSFESDLRRTGLDSGLRQF